MTQVAVIEIVITCEPGKYQDVQGETSCKSIFCDENEYVFNKECLACPPGTYNAPGDDASSGTNTTCDAIVCDVGYGVENHRCVICDVNTYDLIILTQVAEIKIVTHAKQVNIKMFKDKRHVNLYFAMKMNMYLIKYVKFVRLGLIMSW